MCPTAFYTHLQAARAQHERGDTSENRGDYCRLGFNTADMVGGMVQARATCLEARTQRRSVSASAVPPSMRVALAAAVLPSVHAAFAAAPAYAYT